MSTTHHPALPHGTLGEVFPNIYFVTGTFRNNFNGVEFQFSRNMTVLRDGDALTLVNTVRLDDAGLASLDKLGQVKNVVKLGSGHGIDDRFYVDRYPGARQWALPGMTHGGGQETDQELTVGGPMPVADCSLFVFETANKPEGILCINREGGILITCDSLQNWAEADAYFSAESAKMMAGFGFIKPTNIGPGWIQSSQPQASDFQRLTALSFEHVVPAHGTPVKGNARAQYAATIDSLFQA